MIERGGGYLLQPASAAGLLTQIGSATYSVTKHAALAFAEWLAITYGEQGIKVSVLAPQAVNTAMTAGIEDGGVAGVDGMLEPEPSPTRWSPVSTLRREYARRSANAGSVHADAALDHLDVRVVHRRYRIDVPWVVAVVRAEVQNLHRGGLSWTRRVRPDSVHRGPATRVRARAAAAVRGGDAWARGGAGARRSGDCDRRPAAVRQLGDGRVRRSSRRYSRAACVSRRVGRRAAVSRGARRRQLLRSRPGPLSPGRRRSRRSRMFGASATGRGPAGTPKARMCGRPEETPSQGSVVLPSGARLRPAQLGALAAAGITRVSARAARVAVLATGSELRQPGEALGPGQIYEANTTLFARRSSRRAARSSVLPPVADEPATTAAALADGLEGDVLITSGGVSVGEHDLVRPASPRSASRRSSGGSRCGPGSRSRSASAARRSCSGCPATRSRPSSGSSCSCARRCSRCNRRASRGRRSLSGASGRAGGGHPSATSWPGPDPPRGRVGRARPARRPGVAHDRAFRPGRCTRPDRARRRRGGCRLRRSLSPPIARGARLRLDASPAGPGREHDGPDRLAQRPAHGPLARSGVGRVPARRRSGELAPQAPVASAMATSGTLTKWSRRARAGTTARRSRDRSERRRRARGPRGRQAEARTSARAGGRPLRSCGKPEPGVERRQHEDQGERVRCQNEQRDDSEAEQRDRLAGEELLGGDPPPRDEPLAGDEPAEQRERGEPEQREHGPVARRLRGRDRRAAGPLGQAPSAPKRVEDKPGEEPEAEPAAEARKAGRSGMRRRRQCAKRSTAPTKNGMSSEASSSSIAQPRTIRPPAQT